MTLRWTPVAGASGYRIYRAGPGQAHTSDVLVGTVAGAGTTSFTDAGGAPGTERPLTRGSLGNWKQVATLSKSRESAAVVAAPSPSNPGEHFLYVIGGWSATDGVAQTLKTYEFLPVHENGTVGTMTSGDSSMTHARAEASAAVAPAGTADFQDSPFLYIAAGTSGPKSGTLIYGRNDFEAATVSESGQLTGLRVSTRTDAISSRGGAAFLVGDYLVHALGAVRVTGENDPSNYAVSLASSAWGRFPLLATPSADLGMRESTSTSFTRKRYLFGLAQDGRSFFAAGGYAEGAVDADGTPLPAGPTGSVEFHSY